MSTINNTNVLDMITKEFNENHLNRAEIIANKEERSLVILTYDTPVTNVEYRKKIVKQDIPTKEIEVDYEEAKSAVLDLERNQDQIRKYNRSILVMASRITGNAVIAKDPRDDPYAATHYVNSIEEVTPETNKSDQEKFELFIQYLKEFTRKILNTRSSVGIERIIFNRSSLSNDAFHDEAVIYYKDGIINFENTNVNSASTKFVSFDDGLFTGFNIELGMFYRDNGIFYLSIKFTDGEWHSVKLFGDEPLSYTNNSVSINLTLDENDAGEHIYIITGDTVGIAYNLW